MAYHHSTGHFTANRFQNRKAKNMKLRRVVTGFDRDGIAVVTSDGVVPQMQICDGLRVFALWAYGETVGFQAPNRVASGYSADFNGEDMRVNWGVTELEPGQVLAMHSTITVDLITVLEGQVTCVLDSGVVVTLAPHDMLLQRGPVHQWENRGKTRCSWSYAALGRLER